MLFWRKSATLYVHFPCFDGIVSAVLARLYLETAKRWHFDAIEPVNYDLRNQWLDRRLPKRSAVVDFLYHPDAGFWADHHQTTFLDSYLSFHFQHRPQGQVFYDCDKGSCSSLLWDRLGHFFSQDPRLWEMVRWAEKIDSADYVSVEEALSKEHPALIINRSLAIDATPDYCRYLIDALCKASLETMATTYDVQRRFLKAKIMTAEGLRRIEQSVQMKSGVAFFDVSSAGTLINRYAPYHFFPKARYSIGVVRSTKGIAITGMRNPWIHFDSINIGAFMQKFGGGGHQRVGSLLLPAGNLDRSHEVVNALMAQMTQQYHAEFLAKA